MEKQHDVLALGIGNVLWADEGFGVRAIEALNAAFAFPSPEVALIDGGTLGLNLLDVVESSRYVLVFDAVDFGLAPGTLKVLRDSEVPRWGARKMSPHQNGFNDVLALAQLHGRAPESVVAIGVQPLTLDDFGGSLTEPVRARLPEAVALGAQQLAVWGFAGRARRVSEPIEALNAQPIGLAPYEDDRPSATEACRIGDPRLLAARAEA